IEIGNEPNHYGITYDHFRARWRAYYDALQRLVPNAPVVGPDLDIAAWFAPFVHDEGARLHLATAHYYPMADNAASGNFVPTVTNMLSKQLMARSRTALEQELQAAAAAHLPFALDETNSIGGNNRVKGVSEVFASALWGLDFLFAGAQLGLSNMAFFGDGGVVDRSLFSPLARVGAQVYPRPLYYAMLLFHLATAGGKFAFAQATTSNVNMTQYAALDSDGRLHIVLINKDLHRDAYVTLQSAQPFATAEAIRLESPSPTSTYEAVTLGGSGVASDGSWTPQTAEPVYRSSTAPASWVIAVPHASAAAITLSPPTQSSKTNPLCSL